jgi:hypothetical protein
LNRAGAVLKMSRPFDTKIIPNVHPDVRAAAHRLYAMGFNGHPCARARSTFSGAIKLRMKIVHETYLVLIRVYPVDNQIMFNIKLNEPLGKKEIKYASYERAMKWAQRASLWPIPTLPSWILNHPNLVDYGNGYIMIDIGAHYCCNEFMYDYIDEKMYLPGDKLPLSDSVPGTYDFATYIAAYRIT